jgi:hypothetical protein
VTVVQYKVVMYYNESPNPFCFQFYYNVVKLLLNNETGTKLQGVTCDMEMFNCHGGLSVPPFSHAVLLCVNSHIR